MEGSVTQAGRNGQAPSSLARTRRSGGHLERDMHDDVVQTTSGVVEESAHFRDEVEKKERRMAEAVTGAFGTIPILS